MQPVWLCIHSGMSIWWDIWIYTGESSKKCMQCDNYSSHQAGHLRKHLKCTQEKKNFSRRDYASSPAKQMQPEKVWLWILWGESFEKTFETNSTENVHKLQKLEDAKVKQMLQNMCVNLMGWVNLMNWMNFVNWLN